MLEPLLFLFDVDGTLLRLGGAGRQALAEAFGAVFAVPRPLAMLQPIRFDGNTDRAILREAAQRADLSPERFAAAEGALCDAYLAALRRRLRGAGAECLLPGVPEVLRQLAATGHSLGLVTGNLEPGAREKLAPFRLNPYFPAGGFGSDDDDRGRLAALARQRMEAVTGHRFPTRRVYVLGDSVMDVRAGKAQGFRTVALLTGWTEREKLAAEGPDHLLRDLTGLPDALAVDWPPRPGAAGGRTPPPPEAGDDPAAP